MAPFPASLSRIPDMHMQNILLITFSHTNTVKLAILNQNNVFKEKSYFYASAFYKLLKKKNVTST